MTGHAPRTRKRRLAAAAVGTLLALLAFELALQIGAYVLWRTGGRETAATGDREVVLCVGDSFTYGLGASSPESSYPARLQAALDASHPGTFHVVNGGRPGQSTADVLRGLPRQLADYRPAHVVVMAGYNDRWKKPGLVAPDELATTNDAGFPLRCRTLELARRVVGAVRGEGPGSPAPAADLRGSWIGPDFQVQFGSDGVCLVSGVVTTWRLDGDHVVLGEGETAMRLRWERRGDTLRLQGRPLPEAGVTLERSALAVAPTRTGRRVLEDPGTVEALDAEGVVRACAVLTANPEDSPLWWRVAAAAQRGVGREHVLETVQTALERLPADDPWRAGLLRIRAGLTENADPNGALAAILRAALIDGAEHTVTSWVETHAATEPRAAFERALEHLQPTDEDRAQLERMFARATVPQAQVGAVLTEHLALATQVGRDAGSAVWIATYPSREPAVDAAIRAGAQRTGAPLVDVAAAFDARLLEVEWAELFVMDGHCNDAGYALLARTVARALVTEAPR